MLHQLIQYISEMVDIAINHSIAALHFQLLDRLIPRVRAMGSIPAMPEPLGIMLLSECR